MKAFEDKMFAWIRENRGRCQFNLTNSGFSEPRLTDFGINTSYDDYVKEMKDAPEMFTEEIAKVYGVNSKNIIATCGGTGGIFLANAYLKEKVSTVYVPPVEYMPMFLTPQSMDIPVKFKIPDSDDIKSEKNLAFELTNPNNPTGLFLSDSKVKEIVYELEDHGGFVYADETFRHFTMDENPGTIFNHSNSIIVSNTMTKFYGLGSLRVGWMIGDEEVINEINNLRDMVTAEISNYSLWIAAQAIRNRNKFIRFARETLEENRRTLNGFLLDHPELESNLPEINSVAYIKYRWKIDSEEFSKDLLRKTGVLVVPGKYFHDENGFRVCLTSEPCVFTEALEKLSKYATLISHVY